MTQKADGASAAGTRFSMPDAAQNLPKIANIEVYTAFDGQKLVAAGSAQTAPPNVQFVHNSFRSLVQNPQFACVAAKSAFNKNNYRFGLFDGELGTPEVTATLSQSLRRFVGEQDALLRPNGFSTFVASFTGPLVFDEMQFEALLWKQLQSLHETDMALWDASVNNDPDQADFAWSFGGRAFFVVGLHPAASRLTRRFAFPTLVFNAHFQFEELRQSPVNSQLCKPPFGAGTSTCRAASTRILPILANGRTLVSIRVGPWKTIGSARFTRRSTGTLTNERRPPNLPSAAANRRWVPFKEGPNPADY